MSLDDPWSQETQRIQREQEVAEREQRQRVLQAQLDQFRQENEQTLCAQAGFRKSLLGEAGEGW